MGRTRFRILIGLIAFAHLVAASELGALFGFVAIWAIIFALVPLGFAASLIPGAQNLSLPPDAPAIAACAIGLAILAAAARQLLKSWGASRGGDHDEARRRAISGLLIASAPTCLILSVLALAEAWP